MITHEKATDKNIITKQVVINTPTSTCLLPITADEKVIDEIQQFLNEIERLKKIEKSLEELRVRLDNMRKWFNIQALGSSVLDDVKKLIKKLEKEERENE